MSRFASSLRQIAEQLDLPQPERTRIVLEMAADLEDMYAEQRRRGLDEAAATRAVEESLGASIEVVAELVALHRPRVRRLLDRFSAQACSRWERALLAALVAFTLFVAGPPLFGARLVLDASAFVVPVLGAGVAALVIGAALAYRLFAKRDHRSPRLDAGLSTLPFLAAASFFCGSLGLLVELYRCVFGIAEGHIDARSFYTFLIGSSATMVISLIVSAVAAVLWYAFASALSRVERAEAAILLETEP